MHANKHLSPLRGFLLVIMATLACQITIFPYLRGIYHEESVQSLVLEEFLQGFLGVLVGDFAENVR